MLGMKTLLPLVLFTATATAKGLTIEDMLAMQRVSDPQVSPDGKWVAFSVRDTDYDANKGRYDVYVAAADGSSVTRLTTDEANDQDAKWSPDGKWLYFMIWRARRSTLWPYLRYSDSTSTPTATLRSSSGYRSGSGRRRG